MRTVQARHPRAGFSLLEIVIAISLIALLVGVVGFRGGAVVQKGQVSSVVQLVKSLREACTMHHTDTGRFAREYTGYAANNRQLTGEQSYNGWDGPYLERPLAHNASNPWGSLHLYGTATPGGIAGFDTDGDGTEDVTGEANTLMLTGINQEVAEALDDAFDRGMAGDWQDSGRVRWTTGNSRVYILVYH